MKNWKIEIKKESNLSIAIARIIFTYEWSREPEECKRLLEDIYKSWPKDVKVKFLITCGGFIEFDWPEGISLKEIGDPLEPNIEVVNELVKKATEVVNFVLSDDLCNKFKQFTDYITLGVDSHKEKGSLKLKHPHIELVFLKDLNKNKIYWTGKSYPTNDQKNNLVRISDLKTHFLNLDIGKIMILGCHDLTIFNPRSKNAKRRRKKIRDEFRKLAKKERPVFVLQHPHTTVKTKTWYNAWKGLIKILRYPVSYASAGIYYEEGCSFDPLDKVLQVTKGNTNTIDFIIKK